MKIAATAKGAILLILLLQVAAHLIEAKSQPFCQDDKAREKYCHSADPDDIELCLSCYVGPSCPIPGKRGPVGEDGVFLLRGIADHKIQKLIVALLNKQRLNQQWSRCVPLFAWDPALASAAQAWADQCALVEYEGSNNRTEATRLHHDSWRQRSAVLAGGRFHQEPGVAQSVHWAKTPGFDLTGEILESLLESDLQTEDGLVDGLMTNLQYQEEQEVLQQQQESTNPIVFGQATHVGCGWIQFPSAEPDLYENFMVCNFGVGVASKTTCDNMSSGNNTNNENQTLIKYYTVTSEVIKDVKACLEAVRCRRRRRKFLRTFTTTDVVDDNDPCGQDVRQCLSGRSGLKFFDATRLRSVARSNEFVPIDMEATKCKIDTILCGLNSTENCKDRLDYCLPLIDVEDASAQVYCQCADLVLSDGTRGDCTQKSPNEDEKYFCFVKQSPCVSLNATGHLVLSQPFPASGGLLHYTDLLC